VGIISFGAHGLYLPIEMNGVSVGQQHPVGVAQLPRYGRRHGPGADHDGQWSGGRLWL
jgi:hypothetical protein